MYYQILRMYEVSDTHDILYVFMCVCDPSNTVGQSNPPSQKMARIDIDLFVHVHALTSSCLSV